MIHSNMVSDITRFKKKDPKRVETNKMFRLYRTMTIYSHGHFPILSIYFNWPLPSWLYESDFALNTNKGVIKRLHSAVGGLSDHRSRGHRVKSQLGHIIFMEIDYEIISTVILPLLLI